MCTPLYYYVNNCTVSFENIIIIIIITAIIGILIIVNITTIISITIIIRLKQWNTNT